MKRNKLLLLLVASPTLFACSSNNQATSSPQLMIEVKDLTPPVIELKQKTVTLEVGSAFKVTDYVEVIDNMDKQISYDTSGKVDTKKAGTYTLDIKSVDKTGNASHAVLRVVIKEKTKPSETKDTDVPATGTNGTDENRQSTGGTNTTTPSSPAPPSKNALSGKKYLYKDGYNQITASSACNQDLVNSTGAGACIILFDDTGMDIGMMLQ